MSSSVGFTIVPLLRDKACVRCKIASDFDVEELDVSRDSQDHNIAIGRRVSEMRTGQMNVPLANSLVIGNPFNGLILLRRQRLADQLAQVSSVMAGFPSSIV